MFSACLPVYRERLNHARANNCPANYRPRSKAVNLRCNRFCHLRCPERENLGKPCRDKDEYGRQSNAVFSASRLVACDRKREQTVQDRAESADRASTNERLGGRKTKKRKNCWRTTQTCEARDVNQACLGNLNFLLWPTGIVQRPDDMAAKIVLGEMFLVCIESTVNSVSNPCGWEANLPRGIVFACSSQQPTNKYSLLTREKRHRKGSR